MFLGCHCWDHFLTIKIFFETGQLIIWAFEEVVIFHVNFKENLELGKFSIITSLQDWVDFWYITGGTTPSKTPVPFSPFPRILNINLYTT